MDRRTVLAAGVAGLAAAGLGAGQSASAAVRGEEGLLPRIGRALGPTAREAGVERGDGWVRARFTVADGGVPYAVDVVADTGRAPTAVAYLLPGSGMNFAGNFFTPREHNLAHHFRRRGHLVVGVTPREDLASADAITADWGLAAHRRDLRRVVDALDTALRLPYRFVGHSSGAGLALDAAAAGDVSSRLRQVVVIDTTGPYEGELAARAAQTRDLLQAQIDAGAFATDLGFKALLARAVADPDGPSAVPRPVDPTTRFTHAGLAHFAVIRTSTLPGASNWIYRQGHGAGTYTFGATPAEDRFALTHSPFAVWADAVAALGSGLVPTALLRDLAAVWAGDETTYRIAWDRIRAGVVWVNMELGRGEHPRGAELIRAAGNARVSFTVVPGYGHGDPVFSATADRDVWPLLTP